MSWAGQEQLLYSSCAFATTWKCYTSKFGNSVTGPAAHLPALMFLKSDWISKRILENVYFPSNINTKTYTKARQPTPLVLGVNVLWGMPQVRKSFQTHFNSSIYVKRYGVCAISYTTWSSYDETHGICFSNTGFSFFDIVFFHAFLTGQVL